MAKVIQELGTATCVGVTPASEEKEWLRWRQNYVGLQGRLKLCVSECKYPGKQFLYFSGGTESEKDWWLKTSYGCVAIEDGKFVFTTVNSRWIFEVQEDDDNLRSH